MCLEHQVGVRFPTSNYLRPSQVSLCSQLPHINEEPETQKQHCFKGLAMKKRLVISHSWRLGARAFLFCNEHPQNYLGHLRHHHQSNLTNSSPAAGGCWRWSVNPRAIRHDMLKLSSHISQFMSNWTEGASSESSLPTLLPPGRRSRDFTEAESSLVCLKASFPLPGICPSSWRKITGVEVNKIIMSLLPEEVLSFSSSPPSPRSLRESCLKTSYFVDGASRVLSTLPPAMPVLLVRGPGLASSLRASYLSSAFALMKQELLLKAIKSAKSSCSPTEAGLEYSPKRVRFSNHQLQASSLSWHPDTVLGAADLLAGVVLSLVLGHSDAAEKDNGFSLLQVAEENISRSAKFRGFSLCVCGFCWVAPEEGGWKGLCLLLVALVVADTIGGFKISEAIVNSLQIWIAKFSPEKKNTTKCRRMPSWRHWCKARYRTANYRRLPHRRHII